MRELGGSELDEDLRARAHQRAGDHDEHRTPALPRLKQCDSGCDSDGFQSSLVATDL